MPLLPRPGPEPPHMVGHLSQRPCVSLALDINLKGRARERQVRCLKTREVYYIILYKSPHSQNTTNPTRDPTNPTTHLPALSKRLHHPRCMGTQDDIIPQTICLWHMLDHLVVCPDTAFTDSSLFGGPHKDRLERGCSHFQITVISDSLGLLEKLHKFK